MAYWEMISYIPPPEKASMVNGFSAADKPLAAAFGAISAFRPIVHRVILSLKLLLFLWVPVQ